MGIAEMNKAAGPDLAPIDLGGVVLDAPVILAPMAGVTDVPFRRLARRFGAGAGRVRNDCFLGDGPGK